MTVPKPFTIDTPQEKLDWIRDRVSAYRWFPEPADEEAAGGWAYGTSTPALRELQDYWLTTYHWRTAEARLNAWPHFTADIDGLSIHFLHIQGEAGGQRPLLITHGWPGSVLEFWTIIEPLAFPSRHGGKKEDAFDLVLPSLPGYAWSGKPASPIGQRSTAALWDKLMRDVLGYDQYLAQGGDWGSLVTSWLGFDHGVAKKGGCKAIHLNMIGLRPTPASPHTDAETDWIAATQASMQAEGSYLMQQATKPQTLALGLMDSPMGQAAWILEKFHRWSDLGGGSLFDAYSKDDLLTNIMIYLVNDAFATSVWYYNGLFREGGPGLPEGERCETPTGFAVYPGETVFSAPPRSWAERVYNITHWTEMDSGGHFAAMERPGLFVDNVRAWARQVA